jgi:hypothetical protein
MVIKRKIFVKMYAKELVGSTFRFCMVVVVTFNVVNKVRIVRVRLIVIVGQFCYVRINVFTLGVEDYEFGKQAVSSANIIDSSFE